MDKKKQVLNRKMVPVRNQAYDRLKAWIGAQEVQPSMIESISVAINRFIDYQERRELAERKGTASGR